MDTSCENDDLGSELLRIYQQPKFTPVASLNSSDYSYIGTHLIERSIALLASRVGGNLIDIGCGRQPYRSYFRHVNRKVACDVDATRGDVDFTCPAAEIPVEDETFDAILCTEVLEHVPDPLAVWREFHRILRPRGRVLLTTPMYWPAHEQPRDYFRYPKDGLCSLAHCTGFSVLHIIPRGGVWAFVGQVILHAMPQYFPWKWQRRIWNRTFLFLDRWRLNPTLTIGWMILAEKKVS